MPFSPTGMQRAREARGLSQPELAAILGCSVHAIQAWEQGKRTPSNESQLLIARKLRVDLVDLSDRAAVAPRAPVPAA